MENLQEKSNRVCSHVNTKVKYIVLDACVLASYYLPESALRYTGLAERARILIENSGATKRLLVPSFCISEVFSIFAKYRFGKWNTHVKNKTIDDIAYWKARLKFRNDIHNGKTIQQIDLSRYHILATDLVSPIDHYYEYYRSRKKAVRKTPMGAFDHCLAGVGIELVKSRGCENVLIVTADRRLGHILQRAQKVKRASAARLGLIRIARDLGLDWGASIYPRVVNLATVKDVVLDQVFEGWSSCALGGSSKMVQETPSLTDSHKKILIGVYRKVTEDTSESFVYTDEFEIMYDAFISKTGLSASRNQVWKWLSNLRKQKKLPKKGR